jgi:hypothetical protein
MPKTSTLARLPSVFFPTVCIAPLVELSVYANCFESVEDALAQFQGVTSDRGEARKIKRLRESLASGGIHDVQPIWEKHPLELSLLPALTPRFQAVFQAVLEHEKYWLDPVRRPTTHAERVKASSCFLLIHETESDDRVGTLELLLQQVLFSYALYRAWRACEVEEYGGQTALQTSEMQHWKYELAFIPRLAEDKLLVSSVQQMLDAIVSRLGHSDWSAYALQCELTGDGRSQKSIQDKLRRWATVRRPLQPRKLLEEFSLDRQKTLQAPPYGAIVFPSVLDFVCRLLVEAGVACGEIAGQCASYSTYVNYVDKLLLGKGLGLNIQPQSV